MSASTGTQSIEHDLLQALRFGGLDKENLAELTKIAAGFHRDGLKKIRVFPKGIPVVDGLSVKGVVDSQTLKELLSKIVLETPRLTGVTVFPYGIPKPDLFEVSVALGSVAQVAERGM